MTVVRSIDSAGDWNFGKSLNNYLSQNDAVKQNIKTRLLEFLGNCFFNMTAGIDWLNFLGGTKNELALNLNISSVILNTQYVTGLLQLSISLTENRKFSVTYQVQTSYSLTGDTFQYDIINPVTTGI